MSERGVVLILGDYRPSLTIARDMNKRGFYVVVGKQGSGRSCVYSNAVSEMWVHEPLEANPVSFAAELEKFARDTPELKAIFPVAEEYVRVFAEHPDLSRQLPPIVTNAPQLVKMCLDKPAMLKLADDNEVSTASFGMSTNQAEFDQVVNAIGYPVVIRPADSTKRLNGHKALILENPHDLARHASDLSAESQNLLVQAKFDGVRHNVYFAALDGMMTRRLHAIIERTDSLDGTGLAVRGRTLSPDSALVEETSKLVRALNYTGIGCAQFLVNEQTKASSFLEINPRIAGNHALPEYAGLGLADFLFQSVCHDTRDETRISARPGIRFGWVSGDLMGAKIAFLHKEIGPIGLFVWCLRAIASALTIDVHMVFCPTDPKPSLHALLDVLPHFSRWRRTRQSTVGSSSGAKSSATTK